MPIQKYRVDTDKGSYEVEVEVPEPPKSGDEGYIKPTSEPSLTRSPAMAAIRGFSEGAAAGAKGFAKGVVPGVVHGVESTLGAVPALAREAVQTIAGAGHLAEDPGATLANAGRAIAAVPGKIADTAQSALDLARSDPEAFGKATGDVTGQAAVGIGTARAVPLALKPVAGKVGELAETVGKKGQWPIRMMGAHQLGSGNPLGIATMALPEGLKSGGRALRIASGATAADLNPELASKLQDQFNEGMIGRNLSHADEVAKTTANKIRMGAIEKAKQGLEAKPPSVTESVSATAPQGGRSAVRTSYGAPSGPKTEVSTEDLLRKQGLDPNKVVSVGPVTSRADKIAPRMAPPPIQDSRISNIAPEVTKPVTTPPPTSPEQQGLRDNAASRYGSRKIPVGQTLRTANAEKRFASLLRENPEMSIEDAKTQALKETSDAEKANRVRASEDAYRRNKTQD